MLTNYIYFFDIKKIFRILIILSLILCLGPIHQTEAANLANSLKGWILLQVESNGEAWYVNPVDGSRYYLKDGQTAYEALRRFGLGINNTDISKIPVGVEKRFKDLDSDGDGLADRLEEGLKTDPANSDTDGDGVKDGEEILVKNTNPLGNGKLYYSNDLINRLRGKILLQIESRGEAWYVNPKDGKRYYMKEGDAAYQIMRFLSLGITNGDLSKIPIKEIPAPTPKPTEQLKEKPKDNRDSDGDQLENWLEDELGTDKNKVDTDGDGVPDGLDEHPLDNSSIINKIYQVKDDNTGLTFPIRVNIPLDAYVMYKLKLRHDFESNVSNIANYAIYQDFHLQNIIVQVISIMGEHDVNWYQMFRNLVAQIVYNEDAFTGYNEYPKYPIETLVDGSGDCEDTSILLGALLRGFQWRWQTKLAGTPIEHQLDGINVGFLIMQGNPGHVAVGYWVPEFQQIFEPSYKYYGVLNVARYTDKDGKKYCYIETTSNDFAPCEVPKQADELSKNVYIYPLK